MPPTIKELAGMNIHDVQNKLAQAEGIEEERTKFAIDRAKWEEEKAVILADHATKMKDREEQYAAQVAETEAKHKAAIDELTAKNSQLELAVRDLTAIAQAEQRLVEALYANLKKLVNEVRYARPYIQEAEAAANKAKADELKRLAAEMANEVV